MKITLEERLNNLIEEKEEKIKKLETKITELKNFNSLVDTAYQRHFTIPNSGLRKDLPYPRLEMIFEYLDEDIRYGYKWTYGLVMLPYSFMSDKELLFIPFSQTRGSGGSSIIIDGKHELPHKDGMNIAIESVVLGLPAYIINERENHCEKIEDNESIGNRDWVKKMKRQNEK